MSLFRVFADINVSGMFVYMGLLAAAVIAVIVIASVLLKRALRQRTQFDEFPDGDAGDEE